jgi:hypothetical protein
VCPFLLDWTGPNNRKQEFIDFYTEYDPNRAPDLGAHVDFLLANYRFEDIVESLEQKYGTVPQGWSQTAHEEELEQVMHSLMIWPPLLSLLLL